MNIKEIIDQNEWTSFFNQAGSPSFHQAWEWGEFQKKLGYNIIRIGIYDHQKLCGIALVIKIRSKRGQFLFVPHGPLFDLRAVNLAIEVPPEKYAHVKDCMKALTDYLVQLAKHEGYWFVRMAPVFTNTAYHKDLMSKLGYRTAPIYMHAETMWVMDISGTEEEILRGMRKNTRYYIKRGIKDGIIVNKNNDLSSLDAFWELYEKTYTREDFTPFSKRYITGEFKEFNKTQNALFFLGEVPPKFAQEGASRILAGSLAIFTKSAAFYHQGASVHTDYPVPYQVQWQTILEAKRRGCKYYNLYGIYHAGRTPKSWEGLSLFKRGFGGFEVNYLPTQDYMVSPQYYFSFVVDKYLCFRRGI